MLFFMKALATLGALGAVVSADQIRKLPKETVTTESVYFASVAHAIDFDYCYDWDSTYQVDYDTTDYPQEYAYITNSILNSVAKQVSAEILALFEGEGELVVTQHGNAGAVTNVTLQAEMKDLSLTILHDDTQETISTSSSWYARASTDRLKLCEYYSSYYYYDYFKCAETQGGVTTYGSASATTYSSSSTDSLVWNQGAIGSSVEVIGKNLQDFTALLLSGGTNFVIQDNTDYQYVYTNAYMSVYERDFLTMYDKYCYYGWCGTYSYTTIYDYASQYVSEYASAYANAASQAVAGSAVQAGLLAQFERTPGDPKNNNIQVGIAGGAGAVAGAYVSASCNA